jgi:hypothetical protein
MLKGEFTKYKNGYMHANSCIPTGFLISSDKGQKWLFYIKEYKEVTEEFKDFINNL